MKFTITGRDAATRARTTIIETAHGSITTPVFMPVATRGAIRALAMRDLSEIDFDIILGNTYHLYMRPGTKVLDAAGGLHNFMNYHGPILTDSGGFQVFSLAALCKIKEEGAEFNSHIDGSRHMFTPELVLDIQRSIGSDIMMVLDQCCEYPAEEKKVKMAMERTINWARASIRYYRDTFNQEQQALFAIVQGGVFPELRYDCAKRLADLDFPGYAIGGLSVGEPIPLYQEITSHTAELLPEDRPRYMMGVGSPMEILYAVREGIDMFDCVLPTRIARNGALFTSQGRINIKAAPYEYDFTPLDPECDCFVCRNYTKAYLRHIFRVGEISAMIYNTYHNLYFMKKFMKDVQQSITENRFSEVYAKWDKLYGKK